MRRFRTKVALGTHAPQEASMTRYFALALLTTLALAACGKQAAPAGASDAAAPASVATVAAATAPEAKPGAALSVVSVDTGSSVGDDNKLVTRATSFKPSATVIASIRVRNAAATPANAEIGVRWQGPDGSIINDESQVHEIDGETTLNFRIANPEGFPKGNYLLKVLLNGSEVQAASYSID
jgi:hypothetical protein